MKAIIVILALSILSGCASHVPEPFNYGEIIPALPQCEDWQRRGGFCSLQYAVDQVHRRFKYVSDNMTYAHLRNFSNGYQVDVWDLLPESGEGDCEDFALTLRWYLNQRGIRGTNLLTVYIPGNGYHVALELNGWIMDNSSPFVRPREELEKQGWVFQKAVDENGIWRRIVSK